MAKSHIVYGVHKYIHKNIIGSTTIEIIENTEKVKN